MGPMKPSICSIIAIAGMALLFMLVLGTAPGPNSADKNNTLENIAGNGISVNTHLGTIPLKIILLEIILRRTLPKIIPPIMS
jgi:hypothetical protein